MKTFFLFGFVFSLIHFIGFAGSIEDGTAGKAFDVDLKTKSFRFLKQDVPFDEQGKRGDAWFKVTFTDKTALLKSKSLKNLRGIKGPVVGIFTGLNEKNLNALKAGQAFTAEHLTLRPDLKQPTGISADGQSVSAWFTPRQGRFSRDGTIQLNKQEIKAMVQRGGIRISLQEIYTEADLAKGFWKVTLYGKPSNDGFLAKEIRMSELNNPFEMDDPKLPRVLSVGDSISMNYEAAAREALKGVANYHRIEDNCWSTFRGMTFIEYWMGDYKRKGLHWDVIHFNSGLHDMKKKKLDGPYAVSLEDYKKNLKREIEIMRQSGAKLIFCTTTPVQNDSGNARYAFRKKGAEKDFNQAALEVVKSYPDIEVNDLAQAIYDSKVFDRWRTKRDVHFYSKQEQAFLGAQVAKAVKKSLKK